ncbi:hypothetical protein D3C87_1115690 [compost metagenome]
MGHPRSRFAGDIQESHVDGVNIDTEGHAATRLDIRTTLGEVTLRFSNRFVRVGCVVTHGVTVEVSAFRCQSSRWDTGRVVVLWQCVTQQTGELFSDDRFITLPIVIEAITQFTRHGGLHVLHHRRGAVEVLYRVTRYESCGVFPHIQTGEVDHLDVGDRTDPLVVELWWEISQVTEDLEDTFVVDVDQCYVVTFDFHRTVTLGDNRQLVDYTFQTFFRRPTVHGFVGAIDPFQLEGFFVDQLDTVRRRTEDRLQ